MDPLKYAKVERERRWLLAALPHLSDDARQVRIVDRYLHGTRLRLREVTETDGTVVRKLGHKVRLDDGAAEVAHTSLYLDAAEWAALSSLPGDVLIKLRILVPYGDRSIALDVFEPPHVGLFLAEIDTGDGRVDESDELPDRYHVVREVTANEAFSGRELARRAQGVPPPTRPPDWWSGSA